MASLNSVSLVSNQVFAENSTNTSTGEELSIYKKKHTKTLFETASKEDRDFEEDCFFYSEEISEHKEFKILGRSNSLKLTVLGGLYHENPEKFGTIFYYPVTDYKPISEKTSKELHRKLEKYDQAIIQAGSKPTATREERIEASQRRKRVRRREAERAKKTRRSEIKNRKYCQNRSMTYHRILSNRIFTKYGLDARQKLNARFGIKTISIIIAALIPIFYYDSDELLYLKNILFYNVANIFILSKLLTKVTEAHQTGYYNHQSHIVLPSIEEANRVLRDITVLVPLNVFEALPTFLDVIKYQGDLHFKICPSPAISFNLPNFAVMLTNFNLALARAEESLKKTSKNTEDKSIV